MNREYGIEAATVYNNKLWYLSMDFNMLFCLDLESGETRNLGKVACENNKSRLFSNIINYNNLLFFIPLSAEHLVVYDAERETIVKSIYVSPPQKFLNNYDENLKWVSSALVGNKIYMFGCTHSAIGIIDCEKIDLIYDEKWIDECKLNIPTKTFYWFAKQNIVEEDSVFVSCAFAGYVFRYESNKKIEQYKLKCGYPVYKIGNDVDGFYAMSIYESSFIRFDDGWHQKTEIELSNDFHSATPVLVGNNIFVNSIYKKIVLSVNDNNKVEESERDSLGPMFYFEKYKDKYICYSNSKKKIRLLDNKLNAIREYNLLYDEAVKEYYKDIYRNNVFITKQYENSDITLDDLLFMIREV